MSMRKGTDRERHQHGPSNLKPANTTAGKQLRSRFVETVEVAQRRDRKQPSDKPESEYSGEGTSEDERASVATKTQASGPPRAPSQASRSSASRSGNQSVRETARSRASWRTPEAVSDDGLGEWLELARDYFMKKKEEAVHERGSRMSSRRSSSGSHQDWRPQPASRQPTRVRKWVEDQASYATVDQETDSEPPSAFEEQVDRPEEVNPSRGSSKRLGSHPQNRPHETVASEEAKLLPKLISRNVMSKLRRFDGNPADWPFFIEEFESTSRECQFSEVENLQRLKTALGGAAMEAVKPMLGLPGSLNEVISKLKKLFGRPELIINRAMEALKAVPNAQADDFQALAKISGEVGNVVSTAKLLKKEQYLLNPALLESVVKKLSPPLRLQWGKNLIRNKVDDPTLEHLGAWLQEKEDEALKGDPSLEIWARTNEAETKADSPRSSQSYPKPNHSPKCSFCADSTHLLGNCKKFEQESLESRRKWGNDNRICFRCLKKNHRSFMCQSRAVCTVCRGRHHHLFHAPDMVSNPAPPETTNMHSQVGCNNILFKVVPVLLKGPLGEKECFAFLDEGASITMVERNVAAALGLSGTKQPLSLKWAHNATREEPESQIVKVGVRGIEKEAKEYNIVARTVSELSLPTQSVDVGAMVKQWEHFGVLKENSQVKSFSDAKPVILIGQDWARLIVSTRVFLGPWNAPVLSRTLLGWVIHGKVATSKGRVEGDSFTVCHSVNVSVMEKDPDPLYSLVEESIRLDHVEEPTQAREKGMTQNDQLAMEIFERTTRKVDNRWETGLLWKPEAKLPNNRAVALQRLQGLERRMRKDPVFAESYRKKTQENFDKGYASVLSPEELENLPEGRTWYLPHFAVVNPNKPGKLRIVFDAASKCDGKSLNDALLRGPDLLVHIPGLLGKFRENKVAFSADIKEMYPQVLISERDRYAQLFLWRAAQDTPVAVCKMDVMTFGAMCSPFSAQQVKNMNALAFGEEFPRAVRAITQNHYMDDYLDSVPTVDEAISLIEQVRHIHQQGHFDIVNWTCNAKEVLETIPLDKQTETGKGFYLKNENAAEKLLGMWWEPLTDTFQFKFARNEKSKAIASKQRRPTRKEMLSLIMSVFDPLGFLAAQLMEARLLNQSIWTKDSKWDDKTPEEHMKAWVQWLERMETVHELQIPRCYGDGVALADVLELHAFADASDRAYAAVVYLKIYKGTVTTISFVTARARVAPLTKVSVPRLELQAVVLATRLIAVVKREHTCEFSRTYLWTDSRVVLAWLKSDSRTFKPFVAHRVAEIHETNVIDEWRWVPSKQNPADLATKVGKVSPLRVQTWIQGPEFLQKDRRDWPQEPEMTEGAASEETRKARGKTEVEVLFVGFVQYVEKFQPIDVNNVSKFNVAVGGLAWFSRWVEMTKNKGLRGALKSVELSPEEREAAEKYWWKEVQGKCFSVELKLLSQGKAIPSTSRLWSLCPKLDDEGILRVDSRIKKAKGVARSVLEPVILDPKHRVTELLISHYHERYGHQGIGTVVSALQQKYWIIRCRAAVVAAAAKCQWCKVKRASPYVPPMGEMPEERLEHHVRPFTHTGLDYFGPMNVRIGRRTEKRWGALFTCMSTRAVHLEVVHSLTSDSAIMAIRRFAARRGTPYGIISDNATTFKGADRELKEAVEELNQREVHGFMSARKIRWSYIPPGAPHMGGAWERMVRTVKQVLTAILTERVPTDEMLATVFAEAEDIVNARPLTHIPTNPTEGECLTPNHFLKGHGGERPICPPDEGRMAPTRAWRASQQLADQFWNRWVAEYLPTLARRTKYFKEVPPLKLGDVVVIADPAGPRNHWPRGVVVAVYPDKKGRVRKVDVKTVDGTFRRPASRLCPVASQDT